MRKRLSLFSVIFLLILPLSAGETSSIRVDACSFDSERGILRIRTEQGEIDLVFGRQTLMYDSRLTTIHALDTFRTTTGTLFPEKTFIYPRQAWLQNVTNVALGTAGEKSSFGRYSLVSGTNELTLKASNEQGDVFLEFLPERGFLTVRQRFVAREGGHYSLSTPAITALHGKGKSKVVIPGYVHADYAGGGFVSACAYEQGFLQQPFLYQDRAATTPVVILQRDNLTIGVAPAREYPRLPIDGGKNTHHDWRVAYSCMTVDGILAPLLYYPVLGRPHSRLEAGQEVNFTFHIMLSRQDWYSVYRTAVYDVFGFASMRSLSNRMSLSDRVRKIHRFMHREAPKLFRKAMCDGVEICAQDYHGGVKGADGDAMKNSDYGAMWMLARLTGDTLLGRDILLGVRNFKLCQQYGAGTFKGAPQGQYFLWKSGRWVEEWGDHVEPIGITYYSLIDLGNMLLFRPDDCEAKERMRQSADLLLSMQRKDGSWPLGIEKNDGRLILPDLSDYRPTFYGMYVAYKTFGDRRYLQAARKGADWFVANAVNKDRFVGVCGDTRFAPDFATAMSVEALMDMYRLTGKKTYREAALRTARLYTTYIYTHPVPRNADDELFGSTQAGLACEHIGVIGSANPQGPILLSGFSGMFVRLFDETKDSLYLDMARASANGRDRFVNSHSGIASYYWAHFNKTSDPYPQHAWWQIGWITDYLVSEAELRSCGAVSFPRGFITPKVGPHKITGFAPGTINGVKARLVIDHSMVRNDNPALEILTAVSSDEKTGFLIVMNGTSVVTAMNLEVGVGRQVFSGTIEPYGIKIIRFER